MNDVSPEFEKKLEAAAAAPAADPEFVRRLRKQIVVQNRPVSSQPSWWSRLTQNTTTDTRSNYTYKGKNIMRTRWMAPALAVIAFIAIVAFFAFNPVTPVSAQQILDRATAAQTAASSAQGIWHLRFEEYKNPQALPGDQAGTKTITDEYWDLSSNRYRSVTQDAAGKLLTASAGDGSFDYYGPAAADRAPLTVYRAEASQDAIKQANGAALDPVAVAKAIFDQFNNNPRVKVDGKITWTDGSQAYVLVNKNYQASQSGSQQVYTGSTTVIFNAQTYQLLESRTTVAKDGQDIVIQSVRYLVNEIQDASSPVSWDLSDLQDAVIVDEPKAAPENGGKVEFTRISEHELAQYGEAYVLKTIPDGFTLEIILDPVDDANPNEPRHFEVNYGGQSKAYFDMQFVGTMDPGFVETNFYDGSYKSAAGLVLHYTPSDHDAKTGGTAAMLVTPKGNAFLVASSFPREKVEALIEDLVLVK